MELDTRKSRIRHAKSADFDKTLDEIEKELGTEARNVILEVERGDFKDEGILLPVNNIIVVDALRMAVAIEEREKIKANKKAEKAQKQAEKAQKQAEKAQRQAENAQKELELANKRIKELEEKFREK